MAILEASRPLLFLLRDWRGVLSGYDSAGVAVIGPEGRISVRKAKGRLENLKNLLAQSPVEGVIGIGHTRWARMANQAISTPIPIRM